MISIQCCFCFNSSIYFSNSVSILVGGVKINKKIIIFSTIFTFILSSGLVYAQLPDNPWPMFQHDAQHTGRSSYAGPGTEYPDAQVLISEAENDYFCDIVTDSSGILYFEARIGGNGGLYAFYPNGSQKWYYPTPLSCGSPVIGPDGSIYVLASNNKAIVAINSNGILKWEKNFTDVIPQIHPTLGNNGTMYFLSTPALPNASSKLISLNSLSGDIDWTYEIEGYLDPIEYSPAIGQNGTIYFGFNDTLFAINPNGTEKWNRTFEPDCDWYTCRPKVTIPSIADDGTIYVVVNDERDWRTATDQGRYNCLHAIDPEDPNQERWPAKCLKGTTGPPTISSEGNIYFSGWYNPMGQPIAYLYALDSQGNYLYAINLGYNRVRSLLLDENEILYSSRVSTYGSTTIQAFNKSGEEKWSVYLGGIRGERLSLGINGTLYVAGYKLYAISPAFPLSCFDEIPNGDETDVDCGGSCPPCVDGKNCAVDSDCQSDFCHHRVCIRPDLSITDIKPIQTIQDIPLIKDKATMVRVFVDLYPDDVEEMFNVTVELEWQESTGTGLIIRNYSLTANLIRYDGKLYVVPDYLLNEFKNSFGKEFVIKNMIFKHGLDAFNFENVYPPSDIGPVILKAKVDPVNKVNESNESNNLKITDSIKVKSCKDYKILFQRISENYSPEDFTMVKTEEDLIDFSEKHFNYLMATYPLSTNAKFNYDTLIRWGSYEDSNEYLLKCSPEYDMIVYVVPIDWMEEAGFSNKKIKCAVTVKENQLGQVTAHEIGHTFGYCEEYETESGLWGWNPLDAECGIDWDENKYPYGYVAGDGWDVMGVTRGNKPKISFNRDDPTDFMFNHYSFMGSFNIHLIWAPSNFYKYNKYNVLLDKLGVGADPRILLVSGLIYENNTVELLPFYSFDGTPDILDPGNFSVECLSIGNEVLSNASFEPYYMLYSPTGKIVAPFAFRITYPEGTAKIVFKYYDTILKEVVVSSSSPVVNIISINDFGNETYEVFWDATDDDGDTLTFSIYYSHNGDDWYPLLLSLANIPFSYVFDTYGLPGGDNSLIKIATTDGVNTVEAISSPFSVPNKPPYAFISKPLNGSIFTEGSDITFEGWAYDPEEFELNGSSFIWTSSIDGTIGAGVSFTTSNLSLGNHVITLEANDSEGLSDDDTINIVVTTLGDLNGDCEVNILDLIIVGNAFGSTPGQANWNEAADLKPDGKINVLDLSIVGKNFGNEC